MGHNPGHIQFINSMNADQYEMVISCNNIENHIVQNGDKDVLWELKGVNTHIYIYFVSHHNYKGSWCNTTVEWEIGETITYRLSIITLNNPLICDMYTNDNNKIMIVKSTLMLILIGLTLN